MPKRNFKRGLHRGRSFEIFREVDALLGRKLMR